MHTSAYNSYIYLVFEAGKSKYSNHLRKSTFTNTASVWKSESFSSFRERKDPIIRLKNCNIQRYTYSYII
jgi:hypothetical protein